MSSGKWRPLSLGLDVLRWDKMRCIQWQLSAKGMHDMRCFSSLPFGKSCSAFLWRHNGHDVVSNHQPHDCLLNRLFRCRSKKISTLRVTGLCAGNSPVTGEFPAQMASNAENVSIWWHHHVYLYIYLMAYLNLVLGTAIKRTSRKTVLKQIPPRQIDDRSTCVPVGNGHVPSGAKPITETF